LDAYFHHHRMIYIILWIHDFFIRNLIGTDELHVGMIHSILWLCATNPDIKRKSIRRL
jgi:hypothetical protein